MAPHALGTLVGLNWLALSVGTSAGPPLAGLLLDATQTWAVGSWHLVLYCAAASLAVSLAILTLCWPTDFAHEQELLALLPGALIAQPQPQPEPSASEVAAAGKQGVDSSNSPVS